MTEQHTQADVILKLHNKIEDKNKQILKLKKQLEENSQTNNNKETNSEEEEKEEEDEAFFKNIKPKSVGFKERKNAVAEWFKAKGKSHKASIPKISEAVFGYRTANSTHSQYSAMRNAIQDDPRVISANSKDGRFIEYTLNNKVKID